MVKEYLRNDEKLYVTFNDLKKLFHRVDKETLWNVLNMYGVGGVRAASACVRVDGELSENFPIGVGLKQGCVMSPWLFIFMDGRMRKMKAGGRDEAARLKMNGNG